MYTNLQIEWKSTGDPYSEISQDNPLRWYLLKQTGPESFKRVSSRWKCKDFMNEVVVCWHTKKEFTIYNFSTKNDMLNRESELLPLLCELLFSYEVFENNLAVINEYLIEQELDPVYVQEWKPGFAFIGLPLDSLRSTYHMSLYTLLVRAAHIEAKVDTFADLYKKGYPQDVKLLNTLKTKVPREMPEEQQQYIVYCNNNYAIKRDATEVTLGTSMIHNCGIQNSNKPTFNAS